MSSAPVLELRNVAAGYGGVSLFAPVSLALKPGDCTVIRGTNGVGKSTLLRAVFGGAVVTEGEILLRGQRFKPDPAAAEARGLSYMPHAQSIFPGLSVETNLAIVAAGRPLRRPVLDDELFAPLSSLAKHPAETLSGGEQRLLALALSLSGDPAVLIADEPFSGLADSLRGQMADFLTRRRRQGLAILIAEHLDVSLADCDEIWMTSVEDGGLTPSQPPGRYP